MNSSVQNKIKVQSGIMKKKELDNDGPEQTTLSLNIYYIKKVNLDGIIKPAN